MTPDQVEQLFSELRESVVGTRVKFDLQETASTIEGFLIDPPGQRPPGLDDGVFLQDVEDHTQIYCLCEDSAKNGVGNILVHTFVQAGLGGEPVTAPVLDDGIAERLQAAAQVSCGGGIVKDLYSNFDGVVDTNAPIPGQLLRDEPASE